MRAANPAVGVVPSFPSRPSASARFLGQCDTWRSAPRCPASPSCCTLPGSVLWHLLDPLWNRRFRYARFSCGSIAKIATRSNAQRGTCLLSRTLCLGSASGRIPTPGGTPPRHFRRLAGFGLPLAFSTPTWHTPATPKMLRVTLRKSLFVGYPRFLRSPRLGSGDHSLLVARDRWAQKEKRNVPQSR